MSLSGIGAPVTTDLINATADLMALVTEAETYIAASKAPATRRAYATSWRQFETWCERHGASPLPADARVVALYLVHRADKVTVKTVEGDLAAIADAHRASEAASPTTSRVVTTTMAGIRRTHGKPASKKKALTVPMMRKMVSALDTTTIRGARDAALLVVGFLSACRRSELVALQVEDLEFTDDGVLIHIRKSKTDQEGRGRQVALPRGTRAATCPATLLMQWFTVGEITTGSVFRTITAGDQVTDDTMSARAVARCVQRAVKLIGLDPEPYGAHSLRSGFATSAAKAGAPGWSIQQQTGHRSVAMLRSYIQAGRIWDETAAGFLGL